MSLESWWESRVSDNREMQQMQLMMDSWDATVTWFQIQWKVQNMNYKFSLMFNSKLFLF